MKGVLDWVSRKFGPAKVEKSLSGQDFLRGYDVSSRSTGSLAEAYKNSPWVMRAIKYCADPLAGLPLKLTTDGRGGEVPVEVPSVSAFWERPAKSPRGKINRGDLIRASVGWLKMAGECFWILDDSWFLRGVPMERKSPLLIARPQDMQEIAGNDGELLGWKWHRQGIKGTAEIVTLLPEEVIHLACWNPYDELRGLPEWYAARMAAEGDYFAGNFAKLLMENNGDRGPLVTGEGAASDEQIQQVTRILREKRERNKRGEFVPAFLVGSGLKVSEPSVQAVDAAFVTQRLENRHEIFIAFGVPPSFAEVTASYSIGSASDRFRLIEDTCKPLGDQIADAIEEVMNGRTEGAEVLRPPVMDAPVYACLDLDEHSTMQAVRSERTEGAVKLVGQGVPWSVANQYFGLGLPRFEGDEVGRVSANLVEIGGEVAGEAARETTETQRGLVEEMEGLFEKRRKSREIEEARAKAEEKEKVDFERAQLWEKVHGARQPWEKKFAATFGKHLMKARAATLAKLGQFEEKGLVTKAGAIDLTFDLPEWLEEFVDGLAEVSRGAREAAATELWLDELGREDDVAELAPAETLRFLRGRRNMIKDAGERIHAEIMAEIEAGLDAGETMEQLASRTRAAFNGISKDRAEMIATTETTVAYESARLETMEAAGIEFKEWLTSQDERVRLDHFMVDGVVVPLDEPFTVGGEKMAHPGDPNASAGQVIRCRCVMIASFGPATETNQES